MNKTYGRVTWYIFTVVKNYLSFWTLWASSGQFLLRRCYNHLIAINTVTQIFLFPLLCFLSSFVHTICNLAKSLRSLITFLKWVNITSVSDRSMDLFSSIVGYQKYMTFFAVQSSDSFITSLDLPHWKQTLCMVSAEQIGSEQKS